MTVHVVVEGPDDRALLERLLADLEALIEFTVARGKNHARPWARRLQIEKHEPVVLVVDADTQDPSVADAERAELMDYLRWSSKGAPYLVVSFRPTIEVLFFATERVLEEVTGQAVDPLTFAIAADAPRSALAHLLRGKRFELSAVASQLSEESVEAMRAHDSVRQLREFITESSAARKAG